MLNDFLEALRFLTILPLPSSQKPRKDSLARAMFFFPLAGFLIGIVSLVLFKLFQSFFPARVANLILLAAPIVLSGGLHVDGFADFCDGFFAGKSKADTLRIMKDSRIGVCGAVGVFLLLLFKFELLQELPLKTWSFLMMMTASRWAQVILSFYLPYAGLPGGLGEQVARKVGTRELVGASVILFFVTLPVKGAGFFVFLGLLVFLALLGWAFQKKVGGLTGDLLGAASEMTEIFVLLLITAMVRG